ncbi:acetyltransferase [Pectobacterium carotovorum]|uniref:acetyltransferase n=1 Tax=Pectobacterium carotovorum TaxID=554 RepID=UPI0015DED905|nr:acetyltransferase [Pectobacterium carotovorum]MBA0180419.1 acetyltransferase [Pectobacterium carotovorum]
MKLGIFGAGGLGREVLILAQALNRQHQRWCEFVFIDDLQPNRIVKGIDVIDFSTASTIDGIELVVAVGEPAVRSRMAEKIRERGLTLTTLIHPTVQLPSCTRLGLGTIVCQGAVISCDVGIANNVLIQPNTCIGHDCQIGEHAVVSPGVSMGGGCRIGHRAFIGMNATLKEATILGDDVIVSMGAAVFSDVQDSVITLGNPARVMRRNENKQVFK